ncbi:14509_t:CDS:2, partial [Dentiscutata erythropus]
TLVARYEPRDYDSSDESSDLQSTSDLELPSKICDIINDDNWWRQIKNLKSFQLRGILTQNCRAQELNKLKQLYESTSMTFLLNPSKNAPSTSTVQDADNESDYIDESDYVDDTDRDDDDIILWSSDKDDLDESDLSYLESNNINKLQEYPADRTAKWPLNRNQKEDNISNYYPGKINVRELTHNRTNNFTYPRKFSSSTSQIRRVEVFRAIAQEYFLEDSDEELEIIPWKNNTAKWIEEEHENEMSNSDEYINYEWKEELTNNEIERERCYHNLLTKLALEIRIEIAWLIVNGYQNEPTNSNNTESELQSTDLDKAYLVDIPQWGETTKRLKFEDSSDDGYENTGYGYYNLHLDSNHYEEPFPEFTTNLEGSEWLPEFDDYINWDYNNSYKDGQDGMRRVVGLHSEENTEVPSKNVEVLIDA